MKRRTINTKSLSIGAYVSPPPAGGYAPEREPPRWDEREEAIHDVWKDMGTHVPGIHEEVDGLAMEREQRRRPAKFYVYFLEAELSGGIYKVGFAQSVELRAGNLAVGCPFRLIEAASFPCPTERVARDLERAIHDLLKATGHYLRGEWFRIRDRGDVEKLKTFAQQKLEDILFAEVIG